jgi:periplasmic protein TonB
MKRLYTLLIALFAGHLLYAQAAITKDTSKKTGIKKTFTSVEQVPEFPGGVRGFSNYISKNLKYPEVARLIGINGKVNVSFVLNENGKITEVTPKNCIGAGCEAEAARVLEDCPAWKPGMQDGKPVRVMYSIPISFNLDGKREKTYFRDLRKSNYGFVFNIKGTLYTIDEAEKIIGKGFMPDQIEITEPFYNYNKVEKFEMPDKKEVYLIIIKST